MSPMGVKENAAVDCVMQAQDIDVSINRLPMGVKHDNKVMTLCILSTVSLLLVSCLVLMLCLGNDLYDLHLWPQTATPLYNKDTSKLLKLLMGGY